MFGLRPGVRESFAQADFGDQRLNGGNSLVVVGFFSGQRPADLAETLAAYHAVKPHYRRQQHGVGLPVWNMQRRAGLMRHRMTQTQTRAGKGHSRHTGSQQHAFAGGEVVAVAHGLRQRLADHRYRAKRQAIGEGRRVERAVRLNGVGQRINPGHRRHRRRNAFGQGGVENRHVRHERGVGQHLLAPADRIDNHRHVGGFRAGSGGGRHRNERQTRAQYAAFRHRAERLLRVGDQQRDRFRRVKHRTAAKGHHAVALRFAQLRHRRADVGNARLSRRTGPDGHRHPLHRQAARKPGGHSRLMQETVDHHQQMAYASRLRFLTAGAQRAEAAQRHRRHAEGFHPLQIQGIECLKERRLQFSLHRFPPLSLSRCWLSPAGS